MEFKVFRKEFTDNSTIGELHINGKFFCYTLEDKERGLIQGDVDGCKQKKIYSKTAIPYGKYELVMSYSNRFKKYMPQILNVPAFEGIRIHAGNKSEDTEGCILVGETKGENFIGLSRNAYSKLLKKIQSVEKSEKITIEICNA